MAIKIQGQTVIDDNQNINVTGTVTLLVVWDGSTVINQSITGSGTQSFTKNKSK